MSPVPVNVPVCRIPTSVTTKAKAELTCFDKVGSPPPTYKWYKGSTPLPENPKQFPAFQNATYRINSMNGNLVSHCSRSSLPLRSFATNQGGQSTRRIHVNMRVLCDPLQEFSTTTKSDTGSYYCEASNGVGPPQKCKAVTMEIREFPFFVLLFGYTSTTR